MADTERAPASRPVPPAPATRSTAVSETRETLSFLLKLALAVLIFRSFVFAPFSIPSESMLPRLLVGDYLFISKWPYGYSRYSLPFGLPLIPGRVFGHDPVRGDTVVFKAPPGNRDDWIKRVIGLPSDTIQMRGGQLILNGTPIPKQRIGDFVLPITPNVKCPTAFVQDTGGDEAVCRMPRFRETLPGGRSYAVLDTDPHAPGDDTQVYAVPAGHVFLMGDNRDDSLDSRFAATGLPDSGIGFVPMENLEGRATVGFWSTDGSAAWYNPLSWFTAARWERVGEGF